MHLTTFPTLLLQLQGKIHISAVLCVTKWVNIMEQRTTVETAMWLYVLHYFQHHHAGRLLKGWKWDLTE
jgi:hypothetical protein